LVSDEAHLDEAKGRRRVKLEGYARAFHLGVTATPCRLDGIGLKDSYDHLDHVVYPSELLHDGYLAPCRIMAPPENFEPDLKGIRLVRGDYNTKELSKGMVRLVGAVVPQWRRYAKRKPTLVFAVDRNHSKVIAKEFNDAGIRAVHLDGDASAEERREIVAAFKRGDIKVLCSCDLFAAGTDMPWVKVVMLCRPTKSLTLFMQQCGRGVRPHKGHVLTLLDHAGNSEEHGDPFADRDYDLEGRAWFVKPELGPLKCCDGCRRYIRRSLHECPHCGHVPAPRPIEVVEGVNLVQRAANRNDIETEVRAKVASWLDFVVTDEWIDKVVNAKMGKAA
jgi:superfamily II DNA or RNA helicase